MNGLAGSPSTGGMGSTTYFSASPPLVSMSLTAHGPVMAKGAFQLEKLWIMISKETSLTMRPSLAHCEKFSPAAMPPGDASPRSCGL